MKVLIHGKDVEVSHQSPVRPREHRDRRIAAFLRRDSWVHRNPELRGRIARANGLPPLELSDAQRADLMAFLESLTDPSSRTWRM